MPYKSKQFRDIVCIVRIVYPIGRIKNHNDFSENLEEYRPYKTDSEEQQGKS